MVAFIESGDLAAQEIGDVCELKRGADMPSDLAGEAMQDCGRHANVCARVDRRLHEAHDRSRETGWRIEEIPALQSVRSRKDPVGEERSVGV